MSADTLFGARRRRGITRQQLDVTLSAWRKAGTLDGPEYAAFRSALRDLADAVDGSRGDARSGAASWLSHGRVTFMYVEALEKAAEKGAPRDDIDAALSALLRDAPKL